MQKTHTRTHDINNSVYRFYYTLFIVIYLINMSWFVFHKEAPHKQYALCIYWNWLQSHRNQCIEYVTSTTTTTTTTTKTAVATAAAATVCHADGCGGKERLNKVKTAYKIKYGCPQAISSIFARQCRLINWFQCVRRCTQFCAYFFIIYCMKFFKLNITDEKRWAWAQTWRMSTGWWRIFIQNFTVVQKSGYFRIWPWCISAIFVFFFHFILFLETLKPKHWYFFFLILMAKKKLQTTAKPHGD